MKTIYDQNHYDVAIQELGVLDQIGIVLDQISNPNASIPTFSTINLPDTFDFNAKNRIFNSIKIATGIQSASEMAVGIGEMYIGSPIPVFTVS